MPTELALLPVIESAFDPFSNSPAGAAGIWQFMPTTAQHVGLRQDWWFDGRRDIVAATEAALEYLTELHQGFDGDWLMALAVLFFFFALFIPMFTESNSLDRGG